MNNNELFNAESEQSILDIGIQQESIDVLKALQANEGVTDIANLQGAPALQMQSLETTLALLTYSEKHLKISKDIGVDKAFSTVEEYSLQDGYGTEGGFVGQMENPEEDDADFQRKYATIKYIREIWRVADVLSYTKTITNAEVRNTRAAMLRALRTTEKAIFGAVGAVGDATIVPASFTGIIPSVKSLAPGNVFDLRGANVSELDFKTGAEAIVANQGTPSKLYASYSGTTTINNILSTDKQRIVQNQVAGGGISLGHAVKNIITPFGDFPIEPCLFLNPENEGVTKIKDPSTPGSFIEGSTSLKAPATPTFTLTAQTGTTGSQWHSTGDGGQVAGAYYYRVVAVNQYGRSIAAVAATVTVVTGGSVLITITAGAGSYAPTGYLIFRSNAPAATGDNILYMAAVAKGAGATTTYTDKNEDLPGTTQMLLADTSSSGEERAVALKQLAPMHRTEYAKIGAFRWGAVNYYITPIIYAPKRFVVFKNVAITKLIKNLNIDV